VLRLSMMASVLVVLGASTAAQAAVTQPPPPVDPTPVDGETYYLIDQASGQQAQAAPAGGGVTLAAHAFSDLHQRWAMTKAPSGDWIISNVATHACLDSRAVQVRCTAATPSQEWTFDYLANGYSRIVNAATHAALELTGTGQAWEFRPAYFLGNDSSLQEKAEADRVTVNSASAPWWHDAYLPGQDLVQIFKANGLNMIRVRPASINTTVVHDGVTFPITTAPYNNYTLAPPPASQIVPASSNASAPGGTSSGNHAQTDWSAVDLAKRAKELGMAVNVTLFYSGDNTSETPGNWAGKTVDQIAGVAPRTGLMYDYVKQELELFRANGAWPDVVSIGNEVNGGMFTTTGAGGLSPSGTNCSPTSTAGGTGTANCFPRIQRAAMQAIQDAAADTSNPALLGAPLPPPLTCIHVDGGPDLQTFFNGAVNTNGIPLDLACESYYPGWHGPLTHAQQDWHRCNAVSCSSTQHIAEDDFAAEANGLGLPIFTIEDGVSSTTAGSPQDQWYGVNPPGPSRTLSRQGMIDLNEVQENVPNHLSMGMEWWAGEATPVPGAPALGGFWATPGIALFDSTTTANAAIDNATLPAMTAMGGRLDPTLAYKLVNAADGGMLETGHASTAAGAALDTAPDTGITGPQQQWRILAQGADPEQNATIYPTPMDHRGDGFFQLVNGNAAGGANVLDATAADAVVQNPATADVTAVTGTSANQEWDVLTAGNCGDVKLNCAAPPTTGGDYYMIVNKGTGKVLALSGGRVVQEAPAAGSNGDWLEPAEKGQLWRISAARITQATIATTTTLTATGVTLTATIAGGSPQAGGTVTFEDGGDVLGTVVLSPGQTVASLQAAGLATGSHSITAEYSGDAVDIGSTGRFAFDSENTGVSGAVPATLSLSLGSPAAFGAFTPGVEKTYTASTTADVVSTAGDAALSVSDPGHLTNGAFSLPEALVVSMNPSAWTAPVSHGAVTIGFSQHIGSNAALRTGTYSKTLTFTLSTTSP
jgi:arabinogalactan endo-1,4-beta-galactosidase